MRRGVSCAAFTPNGRHVLSKDEKILRLWDIKTGECVRTFEGLSSDEIERRLRRRHGEETHFTFSPDGRYVLLGNNSIAFTPDGRYALSVSNILHLWDVNTGRYIRAFKEQTSGDNTILLWEFDWELEFDED